MRQVVAGRRAAVVAAPFLPRRDAELLAEALLPAVEEPVPGPVAAPAEVL